MCVQKLLQLWCESVRSAAAGSCDEATIGVTIAFQKVGAVDVFEYACALQVTKCGSLPARKGGKFGLLTGALQQMML